MVKAIHCYSYCNSFWSTGLASRYTPPVSNVIVIWNWWIDKQIWLFCICIGSHKKNVKLETAETSKTYLIVRLRRAPMRKAKRRLVYMNPPRQETVDGLMHDSFKTTTIFILNMFLLSCYKMYTLSWYRWFEMKPTLLLYLDVWWSFLHMFSPYNYIKFYCSQRRRVMKKLRLVWSAMSREVT